MAQVGNNAENLGGPYMVQDWDHMVDHSPVTGKVSRGGNRQSEQSHDAGRQQDHQDTAEQQGGTRSAKGHGKKH